MQQVTSDKLTLAQLSPSLFNSVLRGRGGWGQIDSNLTFVRTKPVVVFGSTWSFLTFLIQLVNLRLFFRGTSHSVSRSGCNTDFHCTFFLLLIWGYLQKKLRDVQQEREGTSLNYFKVFFNYIEQYSQSILLFLALCWFISVYLGLFWSILHLIESRSI